MKQYDADFFLWTQETSDQLRRGEFARIDVSALVERWKIWARGRSPLFRAVLPFWSVKWDLQPAKRSRSWQATIQLQRSRIERLLKQSPSLRPFLYETLPDAYSEAVLLAIKDTGLDRKSFAETCPYSSEQIL